MSDIKDIKRETKKEKKEKKKDRKIKDKSTDEEVKEQLHQDEAETTRDVESDEEEEADSETKPKLSKEDKKLKKQKELDELAIDLSAGVPLSKKQQRLLKKGKLDLNKIAQKNPAPKPILTAEQEEEEAKKQKKSLFAVWIGNLSFDTSKEDLVRFIMGKTNDFIPVGESEKDDDLVKVENIDITRINLPKKGTKIKGFAYLDLPSSKHVNSVVSLSEQVLNGRKLLIKNSTSFEGRPETAAGASGDGAALSKNPPSRILFVGNLSFDTTEDNLEEHFRHCGDIVRIRMATFEDSGKCKGFAFIDFKDEEGPTTALKSRLAKKLINRPLRLEFGEDRSKKSPRARLAAASEGREQEEGEVEVHSQPSEFVARERPAPVAHTPRPERKRTFRDTGAQQHQQGKRVKSSVALATAQRASAAIVKSSGKKITFD